MTKSDNLVECLYYKYHRAPDPPTSIHLKRKKPGISFHSPKESDGFEVASAPAIKKILFFLKSFHTHEKTMKFYKIFNKIPEI